MENTTDLAAFQIDVSFQNLELISVEKGESIANWSIFDYRLIEPNKLRVIAARFKENSINNGEILKLRFRSKGNGKIELSGILSNSQGQEIKSEFSSKEIKTPPQEITQHLQTATTGEEKRGFGIFLENYWLLIPVLILIASF